MMARQAALTCGFPELVRRGTGVGDGRQGSLDDPTLGQDKFVQFVALDDLDHPTASAGGGLRDPWPLITGIGEDALNEGKEAARALIENQANPVAVLKVGGMNDDIQQKAERIDKDVALAPGDLLARIKALRIKRGAPF